MKYKCSGCGKEIDKKGYCRECGLESRRLLYIKNRLKEAPHLYLICSNCPNAWAISRGNYCARCGHKGIKNER